MPTIRTYQIKVIGCKVNQYEGQQISELLSDMGLQAAANGQKADLAVVHSCAVTSRAMAKSRRAVRRYLREVNGPVVVSGCGARWTGEELTKISENVKVAVQPQEIVSTLSGIIKAQSIANNVPTTTKNISCNNQGSTAHGRKNQCMIAESGTAKTNGAVPIKPLTNHIPAHRCRQVKDKIGQLPEGQNGSNCTDNRQLGPITKFRGHQRAFVKVQDGCDAFCSYCVVPYLRPRVSWRAIKDVVEEVGGLVQNGYNEVVLAGVHLGAYGQDTTVRKKARMGAKESLAGLLEAVANISGLERVRLSSLEPGELNEELLEVMAGERVIAKHLHLPLQSGSAAVLEQMNRQYTPRGYIQSVELARRYCPDVAISSDIIVGFPGETDQDFQASIDVAEEVGFVRTHVFEFSARALTAAARMLKQIARRVRQERSRKMRQVGQELARQFQQRLTGQELRVLVESKDDPGGLQSGLCEQYFSVGFEALEDLRGQMVLVLLEGVEEVSGRGSLV